MAGNPKSKYFMGWLLVLFDLPVTTKTERRLASKFRNDLLDEGYLMLQFSVYAKCAVTLDKKDTFIHRLKQINPNTGNIQCIFITDSQWGKSVIISEIKHKGRRGISNNSEQSDQLQFW